LIVAAINRILIQGVPVRWKFVGNNKDALMEIGMSSTVIELDNVTKRFGAQVAVSSLSLAVPRGSIYALLGPNGAGKTTTIKMLLGFITADQGAIRVAGHDVAVNVRAARGCSAYIPEQVQLYPQLSGTENLDYFTRLAGHRLTAARLAELLSQVGLNTEAMHRRASTYSKGMRQKVGIAIALAKQAQVLLLDEPTSGLDPSAANEFNTLLKEVANTGVAVLMATHDLFRAHQVATHWGVISNGKLIAERPPHTQISLSELEALYLKLLQPSKQDAA
jgi:ABC-2 type transport system ATP-binding protein